jgi:hypothetical protein
VLALLPGGVRDGPLPGSPEYIETRRDGGRSYLVLPIAVALAPPPFPIGLGGAARSRRAPTQVAAVVLPPASMVAACYRPIFEVM